MKIAKKVIAPCVLLLALQIVSMANAQADYTSNFTCANPYPTVRQLSPIDITPITCANIAVFDISFTSASAAFVFDNTTWYNYRWKPLNSFGSLMAVASDYGVDSYTATWLQFKTPSESSIRASKAPLEVQIYFTSTNSSRDDAIFSFLIYRSQPPGQAYTTKLIQPYFNDTVFDGTFFAIDLSDLASRVNQYPLFYRYPGTTIVPNNNCKNITWYIYSSPVYVYNGTIIDGFRSNISAYAEEYPSTITLSSVTDSYDTGSIQSNTAPLRDITIDAVLIERYCYKEFWRNHIPFNYGIWFALGMLILFFCCQLCTNTNKPIRDPEYQETPLTIHPIYSIVKVSNEIFTRRTRFTVIWMNLTNIAIITSIFAANNKKIKGVYDGLVGPDIFLYGLAGSGIGGAFTYIWGFFLRKYYISKFYLLKEQKKGEDSNAQLVEKHEEDSNFYLYFFYFMTFAWMWGGNLIFVWQMNQINPIDRIGVLGMQNEDMSLRWMASFFVAIGIDWLVLDFIHVILAFIIPFYRNYAKWRGYMYDQLCHETWLLYSKED